MKTILLATAIFSLVSVAARAAGNPADNPWTGHWKLDQAQSHFTGATISYSNGPHGLMHFSDGSVIDYDFGLDGKEYPSAYNRTTSWRSAGKNSWDQVTKANGRVLSKSHRALSVDEKTLTMTFTGVQPDGNPFNEEEVYERVGAGKGLIGTWRSTKVPENAPASFVISAPSADTLHFDLPEEKASVEGVADGTDHAISGPNVPPGMTIGFKQSGTQIRYTIKVNGKPDTYGIETLAADGRSFTDVSWNPGKESEKQTAVYIKQ
jgi:hypothetical protein